LSFIYPLNWKVKMKKWLKSLLCKHSWVVCWAGDHVHKPTGKVLRILSVQLCGHCGKITFKSEKYRNENTNAKA